MDPITPSTYSNTPLKTIETKSKVVITNAKTVRKWKPNPLPTVQQKQPELQSLHPTKHYNCMSRNVVYLITCKYRNYGALLCGILNETTLKEIH